MTTRSNLLIHLMQALTGFLQTWRIGKLEKRVAELEELLVSEIIRRQCSS